MVLPNQTCTLTAGTYNYNSILVRVYGRINITGVVILNVQSITVQIFGTISTVGYPIPVNTSIKSLIVARNIDGNAPGQAFVSGTGSGGAYGGRGGN